MTISASGATGGPPRAAALRVGHVRGVTLTKWRRAWSERLPGVALEVVEVRADAVRAALDGGTVDACLARLPVPTDGLHVIRLYEEAPVVLAAKDHPVAAFDSLAVADLSGELLLDPDDPDALDLAAGGAGVLCVPHAVARSYSRRDLVVRHLTDAAPTTIALVWPADAPNPLVDEFIGIVRGRTANSSRTARERGSEPAASATPAARTRTARAPLTPGGPARKRRPPRGPR